MVKFNLEVKASLENVEKLSSGQDHTWFLKIKCTSCGETSDKWHDLCLSETTSHAHEKSEMNFHMKCKLCSRENWMNIIPDSFKDYTNSDSEKYKQIVTFDCRGLEPVDFSPRDGWSVSIEEGGTFDNVDLTDKEWNDYDEKIGQPVGIYEFESRIVKTK
ncbi:UPF0587 protein GA18326-like [Ctenocephalides felis]|uniref:UPF0587 protein GA18326-like n=1 Tax=Ctenocephalides felis TaxID=7515 RepID=UPI000E6E4B84|nr:UPF0587 protein GA18326-like [Ctenocephalides felis]